MSLHRQLLLSVLGVLLGATLLGAAAIYVHALAKVAVEMDASLAVSRQTIARAIGDLTKETDPHRRLGQIIAAFDGDRHVTVALRGANGALIAQSEVRQPPHPAPSWFLRMVRALPSDIVFAPQPAGLGTIVLKPYPANEVAEAWSDAELTFGILAGFFVCVLAMTIWLQRRAFRPLLQLRGALVEIGAGCYDARVPDSGYVEIQPVLRQFNAMAEQLSRVEQQKRRLRSQLQRIQEDEGAALARDLHDEVAPFLVAVGTDAALIRHSVAEGGGERIAFYAESIAASVTHMQRQLREILARLGTSTLAELGLRHGIEALADFWRQRHPDLVFTLDVGEIELPAASSGLAFRIVQEAVTNAVRHGQPGHVGVRVVADQNALRIDIDDDGKGFEPARQRPGFGIAGMLDRAKSAGGMLRIERRAEGGMRVSAVLPLRAARAA